MIIIASYFFYFVASSISPLYRRYLAKTRNPDTKSQIRLAFEVMLILVIGGSFLPFFSPMYFAGSSLNLFLLSLVCGVFGMGYFILNFVAQKHIDAGVSNIVTNVYTPMTVFLSSILLKEGLSLQQVFGMVLLILALLVVSHKHRISKFKFDRYFVMMLIGGLLLGVLLVAERALQKQTGLSASTMLSWSSQALFLGLAVFFTKSTHSYSSKDVVGLGSMFFLGSLSYVILVYVVGNLAVVSTITTFKVVLIMIGGAIFLGERDHPWRKVIGSVIAILGLLLMK